MNVTGLANLFTGKNKEELAYNYLKQEGVLDFLYGEAPAPDQQIAPEYCDLARLHSTVKSRKVFTILEFGVGFSTLVMGHALLQNKKNWEQDNEGTIIRNNNMFELHTVDASAEWIEITKEKVPTELKDIITIHHSEITAGLFQDRACHYYDNLPSVVPDFIYLDGPDPKDVKANEFGDWSNPDRVVMSGDILRIEPSLLPGTCIAVDGRTANVRFLKHHFFRNWDYCRSADADTTFMELKEAPLGKINASTLQYCLGKRVDDWK